MKFEIHMTTIKDGTLSRELQTSKVSEMFVTEWSKHSSHLKIPLLLGVNGVIVYRVQILFLYMVIVYRLKLRLLQS